MIIEQLKRYIYGDLYIIDVYDDDGIITYGTMHWYFAPTLDELITKIKRRYEDD